MTKEARKKKNQEQAAYMKAHGIERTTGRCCLCYKVYSADMLKSGWQSHRCGSSDNKD